MTRITKVLVVLSLLLVNVALIESRRMIQRAETQWGVNARGREIQPLETEEVDKRNTVSAPSNTLCQNSQLITIPNGNGKLEYDAVYSEGTQPDNLLKINGPCVSPSFERVVYYKFVGNGKVVEISTCNEDIVSKEISTSINVFENFGTCNLAQGGSCAAGGSMNGDQCSVVRLCTTNGATYHVAIGFFAFNEQTKYGTYKFSVETVGDCPSQKNDQCERAIEIFTDIEIEGNTFLNKPSEQNHECCKECDPTRFIASTWYSIKGSDSIFRASTTNAESFIIRVYMRPDNSSPCSITTGNFVCENGHDQYYPGDLTWFAKKDITYYILVSGFLGIEKDFVLTVENLDSARQICQPASELCQNCPPCGEACTEETNVNFYLSNLVQAN